MAATRGTSAKDAIKIGRPHIPLSPDGKADGGVALPSFERVAIHNVEQLEHALSEPTDELAQAMSRLDGDVMILGAGGKIGPSLARMVRCASDAAGKIRRVIAVSRFSTADIPSSLRESGVDSIRGDLLDANFVRSLPKAENIFYLVGMKFGSASYAAQTWTCNTYLAGLIADHFRASRIVALSTGNVYGLSPIDTGRGSLETDPPVPVGEYAMSALGRERVFEYFSQMHGIPTAIIRLNYATELRYGIVVDLAQKVFRGEPVSLSMGFFNAIWQRDACEMILRSLEYASSPPLILNVTGVDRLSCRSVCQQLGERFGRPVRFVGTESSTALLSDASLAARLLGPPPTSIGEIIIRTSDWITRGGEIWNKPTHFEVRDGKY